MDLHFSVALTAQICLKILLSLLSILLTGSSILVAKSKMIYKRISKPLWLQVRKTFESVATAFFSLYTQLPECVWGIH